MLNRLRTLTRRTIDALTYATWNQRYARATGYRDRVAFERTPAVRAASILENLVETGSRQ